MQRTVATSINAAVGDLIPMRLRPVFEYVLEHVNDQLDRDQLAATFGISRRTLHNRLADAGLPPTRTFLTWCRIFVAIALLEQPGHTLDSVSGQLDFNDGGVLANLIRRYTGLGIRELRRHGALAAAAEAFRRQVTEALTAPVSADA
jgi:AraC-like DNA-binding protein